MKIPKFEQKIKVLWKLEAYPRNSQLWLAQPVRVNLFHFFTKADGGPISDRVTKTPLLPFQFFVRMLIPILMIYLCIYDKD